MKIRKARRGEEAVCQLNAEDDVHTLDHADDFGAGIVHVSCVVPLVFGNVTHRAVEKQLHWRTACSGLRCTRVITGLNFGRPSLYRIPPRSFGSTWWRRADTIHDCRPHLIRVRCKKFLLPSLTPFTSHLTPMACRFVKLVEAGGHRRSSGFLARCPPAESVTTIQPRMPAATPQRYRKWWRRADTESSTRFLSRCPPAEIDNHTRNAPPATIRQALPETVEAGGLEPPSHKGSCQGCYVRSRLIGSRRAGLQPAGCRRSQPLQLPSSAAPAARTAD